MSSGWGKRGWEAWLNWPWRLSRQWANGDGSLGSKFFPQGLAAPRPLGAGVVGWSMAPSCPPLPRKLNTTHATVAYLLLNRHIIMILGKLEQFTLGSYFAQRPTIMHFTSFWGAQVSLSPLALHIKIKLLTTLSFCLFSFFLYLA